MNEIRKEINSMMNDFFRTVANKFNLKTGDVTPEQAYEIDEFVELLSDYVEQNIVEQNKKKEEDNMKSVTNYFVDEILRKVKNEGIKNIDKLYDNINEIINEKHITFSDSVEIISENRKFNMSNSGVADEVVGMYIAQDLLYDIAFQILKEKTIDKFSNYIRDKHKKEILSRGRIKEILLDDSDLNKNDVMKVMNMLDEDDINYTKILDNFKTDEYRIFTNVNSKADVVERMLNTDVDFDYLPYWLKKKHINFFSVYTDLKK